MRLRGLLIAVTGTGLIVVAALAAERAWSPSAGAYRPSREVTARAASDRATLPRASVSDNWAGYIDTSGPFTGISATWKVPSLSPSRGVSVAQWVGLGGVADGSGLIQCGVMERWVGGQVEATAVTESLPATVQPGQPVPPGTTVTASVTPSGSGRWTLTVRTGSTVLAQQTVTLSASAARATEASAEWIVEAPSTTDGLVVPLASFGSVDFRGATVRTASGRTESLGQAGPPTPVTMDSGEGTGMQPRAVGSDGKSFTVTETAQSAVSPFQRPYRFRQFPRGQGFRHHDW